MRKVIKLFLFCGVLVIGVRSFAQQNQSETKNPYLESMQQKFQQAYDTASAQFQKQYPKPTAPTVPPMPEVPALAPSVTPVTPPAPQYTYQAPQAPQAPQALKPNIYVAPKNIYQ